jgi:hypothetical protein
MVVRDRSAWQLRHYADVHTDGAVKSHPRAGLACRQARGAPPRALAGWAVALQLMAIVPGEAQIAIDKLSVVLTASAGYRHSAGAA